MMGVALWLLCGLVVFIAARAIDVARPAGLVAELSIAMVAAMLAGLAATALDFGGWGEVDWRAGAFAICCAFAAIGISRALMMRSAA